jgi:tetratricopeptide (TPR) repeat protein
MSDIVKLLRSRLELFGYESLDSRVEADPNEPETWTLTLKIKRKESPHPAEIRSHSSDRIYLEDGTINSDYLLKNAKILLNAKEYAAARKILYALKSENKNIHTVLILIAQSWAAEHRWSEAIEAVEQAIAYQGSLELYQWAAQLNEEAQRPYRAMDWLERALKQKGLTTEKESEVLRELVRLMIQVDRFNQAEPYVSRLIQLNPNDDNPVAQLGWIRLKQGRLAEARFQFDTALAIQPRNLSALEGVGKLALDQKDFETALQSFQRILELKPDNAKALANLVKCAYATKQFYPALKAVENYVKLYPDNVDLLYVLASLQFQVGRYGDSREQVKMILSFNPNHEKAKELAKLLTV